MRLDPDLLRDILTQLVDAPANSRLRVPVIEGRAEDEIFEHLELLSDAGYVEIQPLGSSTGQGRVYAMRVDRVTYAGQQFLAAARNDSLWEKTKATFRERGIGFTLDLASKLLTEYAAHRLVAP